MTTLKRHSSSSIIQNQTRSGNVRRRIGEGDDNCIMSATTGIDNLDNNLLGEILTWLPAKTLLGLKFVNKKWCNLISDTFFINKHACRQTSPCNFFSEEPFSACITQLSFDHSTPNHLSRNTISFGEKYDSIDIHDSCHGLLLVKLEGYLSKLDSHSRISKLCILNPLTNKKKLIPYPYKLKSCEFRLVFAPTSASPPYYYDQYNVVGLVESRVAFEFKIFMWEKERWRTCNKSTRISFGNGLKESKVTHNSFCFRGIIHWLTGEGYIIAFNLDKEESRLIEIPKSVFEMVGRKVLPWWFSTWLGVVEDEVNLVVITPKHEIVTWVLHDYENNKWEIKRNDVINESSHEVYIQPMSFNGERFLLNFKRRGCPKNKWQEYDIQTGVLRSLHFNAPDYSISHISTLAEV